MDAASGRHKNATASATDVQGECRERRRVRQIDLPRLAADLHCQLSGSCSIDVGDDDGRPSQREPTANRRSDASRAAGHQGAPPAQIQLRHSARP